MAAMVMGSAFMKQGGSPSSEISSFVKFNTEKTEEAKEKQAAQQEPLQEPLQEEPAAQEEVKEPEKKVEVWVDPTGQGRDYSELSFAEKLSIKLGLKNVTEDMVLEDFMSEFVDADHEDVSARDEIFKRITADFSCEIGKVRQLLPS